VKDTDCHCKDGTPWTKNGDQRTVGQKDLLEQEETLVIGDKRRNRLGVLKIVLNAHKSSMHIKLV